MKTRGNKIKNRRYILFYIFLKMLRYPIIFVFGPQIIYFTFSDVFKAALKQRANTSEKMLY